MRYQTIIVVVEC